MWFHGHGMACLAHCLQYWKSDSFLASPFHEFLVMHQLCVAVAVQCISRHPRRIVVESALFCSYYRLQCSLGSLAACTHCASSTLPGVFFPGIGSKLLNTETPNWLRYTVQCKKQHSGTITIFQIILESTVDNRSPPLQQIIALGKLVLCDRCTVCSSWKFYSTSKDLPFMDDGGFYPRLCSYSIPKASYSVPSPHGAT